jgi:hypothetical protein
MIIFALESGTNEIPSIRIKITIFGCKDTKKVIIQQMFK